MYAWQKYIKDPNAEERTNNQGYLTQLLSYACINQCNVNLAGLKQFAKLKCHYSKPWPKIHAGLAVGEILYNYVM